MQLLENQGAHISAVGLVGEWRAMRKVKALIPGAKRLTAPSRIGEKGIDGIYKVEKEGVTHYVVVEAKDNKAGLGWTRDGRQASHSWLRGDESGINRLQKAVGRDEAELIRQALDSGRVETWLVRINTQGACKISLRDPHGKALPALEQVSKLITKE